MGFQERHGLCYRGQAQINDFCVFLIYPDCTSSYLALLPRALICTPDFTDLVYTLPFSFISCWCKDACGTAKPTDSCPLILHASFNSATLKYPECPQEVYGPDAKPTEINDGRRGFPVTSMNIVSCPKALLSNANWYYINVTPLLKAVAAHPKLAQVFSES